MDELNEVCFVVPGDPKSKGRPRFTRYGSTYTPKTTVEAEKVIKEILTGLGLTPYTERCGVNVEFYCKTLRRTDGDNLMKLVLDACNTLVYTDDYLVEEVRYRIHRKVPGEPPRTEVMFYPLED